MCRGLGGESWAEAEWVVGHEPLAAGGIPRRCDEAMDSVGDEAMGRVGDIATGRVGDVAMDREVTRRWAA